MACTRDGQLQVSMEIMGITQCFQDASMARTKLEATRS